MIKTYILRENHGKTPEKDKLSARQGGSFLKKPFCLHFDLRSAAPRINGLIIHCLDHSGCGIFFYDDPMKGIYYSVNQNAP